MASLSVKNIMQSCPATLSSGQSLVEAVEVLIQHKTTGLPVIDRDYRVIGFVSEQDCIKSLLQSSYYCEGNPVVDDVMQHQPLTVKPSDSVLDLAKSMGSNKPKVYPAVEHGKLVGLVTRAQVLNVLREEAMRCTLVKTAG